MNCVSRIQTALENLGTLLQQHNTYTNLISNLEEQLKDSRKVKGRKYEAK